MQLGKIDFLNSFTHSFLKYLLHIVMCQALYRQDKENLNKMEPLPRKNF